MKSNYVNYTNRNNEIRTKQLNDAWTSVARFPAWMKFQQKA